MAHVSGYEICMRESLTTQHTALRRQPTSNLHLPGEADDLLKRFVLLRKRKGNSDLLFALVRYFMGALETELLMLFISASYSLFASLNKSERFVLVI